MDGWPTQEAVERALDALDQSEFVSEDHMLEVLQAAGLPELLGATAAAHALGVATGNLGKVVGLPEPLYVLPAGKFYAAAAVRGLASARRRARRAVAAE